MSVRGGQGVVVVEKWRQLYFNNNKKQIPNRIVLKPSRSITI